MVKSGGGTKVGHAHHSSPVPLDHAHEPALLDVPEPFFDPTPRASSGFARSLSADGRRAPRHRSYDEVSAPSSPLHRFSKLSDDSPPHFLPHPSHSPVSAPHSAPVDGYDELWHRLEAQSKPKLASMPSPLFGHAQLHDEPSRGSLPDLSELQPVIEEHEPAYERPAHHRSATEPGLPFDFFAHARTPLKLQVRRAHPAALTAADRLSEHPAQPRESVVGRRARLGRTSQGT